LVLDVPLEEKSNFLRKIDNWLKQNPAYAPPIKMSNVKIQKSKVQFKFDLNNKNCY
jgi:hypothetical protein